MLLWQDEKKNYEGEEEKVKTEVSSGNSSLRDMWNIQTDRLATWWTVYLICKLLEHKMFWFHTDSGRLLHAVKLNSLTAIAAVGCTKRGTISFCTRNFARILSFTVVCVHTPMEWEGVGVICLAGTWRTSFSWNTFVWILGFLLVEWFMLCPRLCVCVWVLICVCLLVCIFSALTTSKVPLYASFFSFLPFWSIWIDARWQINCKGRLQLHVCVCAWVYWLLARCDCRRLTWKC